MEMVNYVNIDAWFLCVCFFIIVYTINLLRFVLPMEHHRCREVPRGRSSRGSGRPLRCKQVAFLEAHGAFIGYLYYIYIYSKCILFLSIYFVALYLATAHGCSPLYKDRLHVWVRRGRESECYLAHHPASGDLVELAHHGALLPRGAGRGFTSAVTSSIAGGLRGVR